MKRRHAIVAGLVVGVVASAGVMAAAAGKAPVRAPNGHAVGPALAADTGAGELLIAVVGGVFPSTAGGRSRQRGAGLRRPPGLLRRPGRAVPGVPSGGRRAGRVRARERVPYRGGRPGVRRARRDVRGRGDDPARAGSEPGRPLRGSGAGGQTPTARVRCSVRWRSRSRDGAERGGVRVERADAGGVRGRGRDATHADRRPNVCEVQLRHARGVRADGHVRGAVSRSGRVRVGFDDEGRELHAFAGIPASSARAPGRRHGRARRRRHGRLAAASTRCGSSAGTRAGSATQGRPGSRVRPRGFLELLRRAGVAAA